MNTPRPLPAHPDNMRDEDLSAYVQQLVDDQVEEGLNLDYKGQAYDLSSTGDKRDLAKDTTSFANTEGGLILVGIPEKRENQTKTRLPDPDYGTVRQPDYEARASQILGSSVSPILPQLRIRWVPKMEDAAKGVYLVWHPQSYLRPHMVHALRQHRYFERHEDRSEPMDEQAVERLYQQRLHGEHRAEAFLSDTDFSIGYKARAREGKYAYMTLCICPRLLLDGSFDFSDDRLRSWVSDKPFGIPGAVEPWKPASWGAFLVCERDGKFRHTAQLYSNGSLAVAARVARHLPNRQDESKVSFTQIRRYLQAAYGHVAKLYSYLGNEYVELRVRLTFDDLAGCCLQYPSGVYGGGIIEVTAARHILDEGLNVATIIADLNDAIKPMLDQIWRTFELGWQVPAGLTQRLEAG